MKYLQIYCLLLVFAFCNCSKGQNKTDLPKDNSLSNTTALGGPKAISRTIKQDRKGNIWIAAFDGVFRYDGKSFTNITKNVSSARFFSVLEDSKGNLWFGSIGSGVYLYDGQSFKNFTTKDGLPNNEIVSIYEDKIGNIWFGANGGVSRYDGKSFQNFMLIKNFITNVDSMIEDKTGLTVPDFTRPPNEFNAIIEDQTGKLWFATRGNTYIYDGKTFTIVTHDGKPFANVRWVIEDKKENIWLGGADGLWRSTKGVLTNITTNFVGYIYEDRKGNIWTSSESKQPSIYSQTPQGWVLSRYDEKSLSNPMPTATEINPNSGMLFGILEDAKGNIWFGASGVYRYDGKNFTDFKSIEGQK